MIKFKDILTEAYYMHGTSIRNIKSILTQGLDPDYGANGFWGSSVWANKEKNDVINDYYINDSINNNDEIYILFKTNIKPEKQDDRGYTFDDIIPPNTFQKIVFNGKVFTIDEFKKKLL